MLTKKILTSEPAGGLSETPLFELDRPLQVKTAAGSFSMVAYPTPTVVRLEKR